MVPNELRAETILSVFTRFAEAGPSPLAKYFTPMGADTGGNVVKYDVLSYQRSMADMVAYDARAPRTEMPSRAVVTYEPPTYKQSIQLPPSLLKTVRDVGSLNANQQAQVARAVKQLALNLDRRQDWLRAQFLTFGACLTSAGVAPSTTAAGTVYLDSRFSATTTPQALAIGISSTHAGSNGGAAWTTAGTDVKSYLDTAHKLIMQDSGVDARRLVINSTIMAGLIKNTGSGTRSELYKALVDKTGGYPELWGYEIEVIDNVFPFDSSSMATDTGAVGQVAMIPGGVAILLNPDNVASGRYMIESEPSDVNAPQGARGAYAWQDGDWQHPHMPEMGIEWTGGPAITNPDSMYVWASANA